MLSLSKIFKQLKPFKVMVLGDFLLDSYTTGIVRRISPEAPVPIMEVLRKDSRPGGAGNVALGLKALGGIVYCVGRVGNDLHGKELKEHLGSDHRLLLAIDGYDTPVKNRLIANSQQLMRIDQETITPIEKEMESFLIEELKETIPKMDVIALSDYGKGFLTDSLIKHVLATANEHRVATIVDPKGLDFAKYSGSTLIKPNLLEAYAAAKMPEGAQLTDVAKEIFLSAKPEHLLITRSEAGLSLFSKDGTREDFPVISKQVKDVTGAGDTVLSTLCLGIANGLDLASTLRLANIAAGIVIEKIGCAQVTLKELQPHLNKHLLYKKQQTVQA